MATPDSAGPAPPITPPHAHKLTDNPANRGRTLLVTRPDGSTYYRKPRTPKPPKDSKVRKAAIAYLAMRASGATPDEIAEQLGLAKHTVQMYVQRARAKGWLDLESFDNPSDRLEHVIAHTVVGNISKVLGEKDQIVVKGDAEKGEADRVIDTDRLSDRAVDMTTEVAKGLGLLKTHQVTKQEGGPALGVALRVHVEMPAVGPVPVVRPGSTGGTPAIDAEIIS